MPAFTSFPVCRSVRTPLTAEHPGFKKLIRTNIEVRVGLRISLDIQLEVGDVQQTVEVEAEASLLETSKPERGQNVSPQLMNTLPLFNGALRNAEAFVGYMPGVNGNGETSINGSNGRAKEVEIDGASLTIPESGGVSFNFPGFEAYGEFKLITASFNAEYGRLGGGLEQFTTKSGTNRIHAAAFLNIKRDVLDADAWANNQNPANPQGFRPKERFNEEGGTAGGPDLDAEDLRRPQQELLLLHLRQDHPARIDRHQQRRDGADALDEAGKFHRSGADLRPDDHIGEYAHALRRQPHSAEPLEQDQQQHSAVHSRPRTCRGSPATTLTRICRPPTITSGR